MAGRGTRATAADYNNIQSTIASVMGPTSGYGQAILSSQVAAGATITVAQWDNLRSDLSRARTHISGLTVVDGLASVEANRGSPWQTLQDINVGTTISEAIREQYALFTADGVNAQRYTSPPGAGQFEPDVAVVTAPLRTALWGGTTNVDSVSHTFTLTFPGYTVSGLTVTGEQHMNSFFNAGGAIEITASFAPAASNLKNNDWQSMLSGFGTLYIRRSACAISGTVNAGGSWNTTQGYTALTAGGSAITALTQSSSASKYAENRYIVTVQRPATVNQLLITVTFRDLDEGDRPVPSPPPPYGPLIDEDVNGTLTSRCACTRPIGGVAVPAPTGTATAIT